MCFYQRISTSKYLRTKLKLWLLREKHLVRSKIEIDGSVLEHVRQFDYLGCELSLDGETEAKLCFYQRISTSKYLRTKLKLWLLKENI